VRAACRYNPSGAQSFRPARVGGMSFDVAALETAISVHGAVARVVVAETRGSVPREVGAAMVVWADGQSGTIGGGALEWEAAARARAVLAGGADRIDRIALGPGVGQCCGGAVTLLTERWDEARLRQVGGAVAARPVPGRPETQPLSVRRRLQAARGEGQAPAPGLVEGWMVEPVSGARREVWIWGAGHVGRAIVGVLAPLPDIAVIWIDTDAARFPDAIPEGVTRLVTADPAAAAAHAPLAAEHYVLTYSHALDLALCHALLTRGFARCGLIGSATKRARFRRRLAELGHAENAIARIRCPIGDPALGKHPQAIAVGVATELLAPRAAGVGARTG
jgi:xanthine dehydrogenase accessory factor